MLGDIYCVLPNSFGVTVSFNMYPVCHLHLQLCYTCYNRQRAPILPRDNPASVVTAFCTRRNVGYIKVNCAVWAHQWASFGLDSCLCILVWSCSQSQIVLPVHSTRISLGVVGTLPLHYLGVIEYDKQISYSPNPIKRILGLHPRTII